MLLNYSKASSKCEEGRKDHTRRRRGKQRRPFRKRRGIFGNRKSPCSAVRRNALFQKRRTSAPRTTAWPDRRKGFLSPPQPLGYAPPRTRHKCRERPPCGKGAVLLSEGEIDAKRVRVKSLLKDMDMSGFRKGAAYAQIKEYLQEFRSMEHFKQEHIEYLDYYNKHRGKAKGLAVCNAQTTSPFGRLNKLRSIICLTFRGRFKTGSCFFAGKDAPLLRNASMRGGGIWKRMAC